MRSPGIQVLVAILLGTVVVLVPNTILRGGPSVSEVMAALIWVSVDGWLLAVALRWGQRRAIPTAWTLAAGYCAVLVFGAIWLEAVIASGLVAEKNAASRKLHGILADGAYSSLLILGTWGLFYVMPRVVRDARDREKERQELLREAERSRVRAALEPHFVLNTLTAIGALIGDEPGTARELIGDLGDLLRDVVRLANRDRQTAAEEVAWLQRYARVLEARHRGRLAVDLHLDAAAADIQVPVGVLQPLVENAIRHGALQRPGGGHVLVDVRLVANDLRCTIEDDGPGIVGAPGPDSHGLSLTRRRLASSVADASLAIDSSPTGTRAVVTIPVAS